MSSTSSSSSSSSSSLTSYSVAGGNYYDLTTANSDSDHDADADGSVPPSMKMTASGRRRITEVNDGRRTYANSSRRGRISSTTTSGDGPLSAPTTTTARSKSRQRTVSIIDLVNDSEEETDEAAGKKRSLPLPSSSSPPHQSNFKTARQSMRRKRSRIPSASASTSSSEISENSNAHRIGISSSQQAFVPTATTRTHVSHHLNLPARHCQRDGATITFGLLSLINNVLKDGNSTLTCCQGSVASSRSHPLLKRPMMHEHPTPPALLSSSSSSSSSSSLPSSSAAGYHHQQHHHLLPYNHQPFHYLQHDNWSCGYRNLQMLLSSMMPSLLSIFPRGVPCIEEIQRTMEVLWSKRYDIRNAEHHKYSLVGKKTWIGTVEVWSYLSYMRVDSIIVQFIKTSQNRALLGRFVWAYFNRVCHTPFGCSSCHDGHDTMQGGGGGAAVAAAEKEDQDSTPLASPILTSLEYADHILREITQSNNNVNKGEEQQQQRCRCSIPPLYLQWEGHSVTVVGIKRIDCTSTFHRCRSESSSPPQLFSLIIFCPQKNVANVKNALTKEFHSRNIFAAGSRETTMVDSINNNMYKSYLSNPLKNKGNNNYNSILELPVTKLFQKDCQILLATGRTIDDVESKRRTVCSKEIGYLNASILG